MLLLKFQIISIKLENHFINHYFTVFYLKNIELFRQKFHFIIYIPKPLIFRTITHKQILQN